MIKHASVFRTIPLFTLSLGLLVLNSCTKGQKDQPVNNNPGYYDDSKFALASDYFPMKEGHVWYYSVYTANSIDTVFDYNMEARIDSGFGRTNYYQMPGEIRLGYMFWYSYRSSEILAGGGYLFHTRLINEPTSFEEIKKINYTHNQAQIGGLHEVTTPEGSYLCIRNEHRYMQGDSIHQVRYFAKNKGRVKEEKYKIIDGIKYPISIQILDSTSF